MIRARLAALLAIASVTPAGWAAPRETSPGVWVDVARVVAVGDVHGSFEKLARILVAGELTDAELNWNGGSDHLVLVGDFTDRGKQEREVIDLLRRLQDQAQAAGGRVHALLGNHEVMNLIRDLRYVEPEGFAAFAGDESARERKRVRKSWVEAQAAGGTDREIAAVTFDNRFPRGFLARSRAFEDGDYGAWLMRQPVTVQINGVVFVHGGIAPRFATLGIGTLNTLLADGIRDFRKQRRVLEDRGRIGPASYYRDQQQVASKLLAGEAAVAEPELRAAAAGVLALAESPFFGAQGPLWHRAYSVANERYERANLAQALDSLSARAMVLGHTITRDGAISSRFAGTLYRTDVGLASGGDAQALILDASGARVLDARDASTREPVAEPPAGQEAVAESIDGDRLRGLLQSAPAVADRVSGGAEANGARLLHLRQDGVSVHAAFWDTSELATHRRATQELAAFALDRVLDLNLVPLTLVREVEGEAGALQHVDDRAIDGQSVDEHGVVFWDPAEVRRQRARARVFDALIGNCRRPSTEVLYLPDERRMLLVNHSRAFAISPLAGCDEEGPAPEVDPEIDPELRIALAALSVERLTQALGGWLNAQQIEAILLRRDRLVGSGNALDAGARGGRRAS